MTRVAERCGLCGVPTARSQHGERGAQTHPGTAYLEVPMRTGVVERSPPSRSMPSIGVIPRRRELMKSASWARQEIADVDEIRH